MTGISKPATCDDAPDHLDPQPFDSHRWHCTACGAEWRETLDVEVAAEGTRSGVRVTIGTTDFDLTAETAHVLSERIQQALQESGPRVRA